MGEIKGRGDTDLEFRDSFRYRGMWRIEGLRFRVADFGLVAPGGSQDPDSAGCPKECLLLFLHRSRCPEFLLTGFGVLRLLQSRFPARFCMWCLRSGAAR